MLEVGYYSNVLQLDPAYNNSLRQLLLEAQHTRLDVVACQL